MNEITFPATIFKIQTLTDKGLRLSLDLQEDAIPQAAMLMEISRQGIPIIVKIQAGE